MRDKEKHRSLQECLYYLVREMGDLAIRAKDEYFECALEHVKRNGLKDMRSIEINALIGSARARNRLKDLDKAVEKSEANSVRVSEH